VTSSDSAPDIGPACPLALAFSFSSPERQENPDAKSLVSRSTSCCAMGISNSSLHRNATTLRHGEAYDLLQALNTGHAGSLSTIHGNSGSQALARLASCAMQAGVEIPYAALRLQIGEAIAFVVHLARRGAHRMVDELCRVSAYDVNGDVYDLIRYSSGKRVGDRGEA